MQNIVSLLSSNSNDIKGKMQKTQQKNSLLKSTITTKDGTKNKELKDVEVVKENKFNALFQKTSNNSSLNSQKTVEKGIEKSDEKIAVNLIDLKKSEAENTKNDFSFFKEENLSTKESEVVDNNFKNTKKIETTEKKKEVKLEKEKLEVTEKTSANENKGINEIVNTKQESQNIPVFIPENKSIYKDSENNTKESFKEEIIVSAVNIKSNEIKAVKQEVSKQETGISFASLEKYGMVPVTKKIEAKQENTIVKNNEIQEENVKEVKDTTIFNKKRDITSEKIVFDKKEAALDVKNEKTEKISLYESTALKNETILTDNKVKNIENQTVINNNFTKVLEHGKEVKKEIETKEIKAETKVSLKTTDEKQENSNIQNKENIVLALNQEIKKEQVKSKPDTFIKIQDKLDENKNFQNTKNSTFLDEKINKNSEITVMPDSLKISEEKSENSGGILSVEKEKKNVSKDEVQYSDSLFSKKDKKVVIQENKGISEVSDYFKQVENQEIKMQDKSEKTVTATVDYDSIYNQVDTMIKTSFNAEANEFKIKLTPEDLGEVEVKINIEKNVMLAEFSVENEKVKETLESRFNELKNNLSEKGIDVASINVTISNGNSNGYQENKYFTEENKKNINNLKINGVSAEKEYMANEKKIGYYGLTSAGGLNFLY